MNFIFKGFTMAIYASARYLVSSVPTRYLCRYPSKSTEHNRFVSLCCRGCYLQLSLCRGSQILLSVIVARSLSFLFLPDCLTFYWNFARATVLCSKCMYCILYNWHYSLPLTYMSSSLDTKTYLC